MRPLDQAVHIRRISPAALTLLALALAGCGDDVTDPDAFLESAEAEAVMASARGLPMLPTITAELELTDGQRAALIRAEELWAQGNVADGRDRSRRRLAVEYAFPVLSRVVPEEHWGEIRQGMDDWMGTVETMLARLTMPRVEDRLDRARRFLDRADALEGNERSGYYLLRAMAELVETTPRYVARLLVQDADRLLMAAPEPDSRDEARDLDRARRLKDWAQRAVEEGDDLLAIQRAYYAIQLLEGP